MEGGGREGRQDRVKETMWHRRRGSKTVRKRDGGTVERRNDWRKIWRDRDLEGQKRETVGGRKHGITKFWGAGREYVRFSFYIYLYETTLLGSFIYVEHLSYS